MKKLLLTTLLVVTFFACSAVSASAVVNDTVKVGLRYGSSALFSANLENAEGAGYAFGYFNSERSFEPLGRTEETAVSMTAAGTFYLSTSGGTYSASVPSGGFRTIGGWHAELDGFGDFDEAMDEASAYDGGYPAWIDGEYVVRVGCYEDRGDAEAMADEIGGSVVKSSSTGVLVTVTRSTEVLFEFDCQGAMDLGVQPDGRADEPVTWFKGYKYNGGFEYPRVTGGNLNVVNVVDLESYVKGVVPYEMGGAWPEAALEAQAVCARTYVQGHSKHLSGYGFDVCSGTCCQVYNGRNSASGASDQAVDNTAGECLYYDGNLVQDAVYHASNGGATEDAQNVWGGDVGYLIGKEDPYEAMTTIPNYSWSVTYSAAELTWILQQKGYSIGTVRDVYVSEYTDVGNVYKVTFVDGSGESLTVKGDTARTIFYSSTYKKAVNSMRFDISGGSGGERPSASGGTYYVNGSGSRLSSLDGVSVISGGGTVTTLPDGGIYVCTSSGTSLMGTSSNGRTPQTAGNSSGSFTITGTGNGHNVGLSQYGAKAMAEQGYTYDEILDFYYTDITIG